MCVVISSADVMCSSFANMVPNYLSWPVSRLCRPLSRWSLPDLSPLHITFYPKSKEPSVTLTGTRPPKHEGVHRRCLSFLNAEIAETQSSAEEPRAFSIGFRMSIMSTTGTRHIHHTDHFILVRVQCPKIRRLIWDIRLLLIFLAEGATKNAQDFFFP